MGGKMEKKMDSGIDSMGQPMMPSTMPSSMAPPMPSSMPFSKPMAEAMPANDHMAPPQSNRLNIVELYQSHGCSSCPPTNRQALDLIDAQDPNTLVLDFHVTYWDHLGWTDTFGVPGNDTRQRDYSRGLRRKNVYTPQIIVNGIAEGVGNTRSSFNGLVTKGSEAGRVGPAWVEMEVVEGDALLVTEPAGRNAMVVEIVYDPSPAEVHIKRGENRGITEPVRNVVKSTRALEKLTGGAQIVRLGPRPDNGWQRVILVQQSPSQAIIGALKV